MGRGSQFVFGWTDMANAFLNSFGSVALVVMIYAFPARIGLMILFGLLYFSFAAPFMMNFIPSNTFFHTSGIHHVLSTFSNVIHSFMYSPIDLDAYFNSLRIFWLPAISFFSNITLYLLTAIVVINSREFFYNNE